MPANQPDGSLDGSTARGAVMDKPKRGDGLDCKCAAWAYFECACGADWTPREVYELRAEVAKLKEDKMVLVGALKVITDYADEKSSVFVAEQALKKVEAK